MSRVTQALLSVDNTDTDTNTNTDVVTEAAGMYVPGRHDSVVLHTHNVQPSQIVELKRIESGVLSHPSSLRIDREIETDTDTHTYTHSTQSPTAPPPPPAAAAAAVATESDTHTVTSPLKLYASIRDQRDAITLASNAMEISSAVHSIRGRREHMEDRHIAMDPDQFRLMSESKHAAQRSLFAIIDGHGGDVCAEYVRRNVPPLLNCAIKKGRTPPQALTFALTAVEQNFLEDARSLGLQQSSGACCVAAYIENNVLVIANVGDSRAVLCHAGKARALSSDHKPQRDSERLRIMKMGGYIARSRNEVTECFPGQYALRDFCANLCGAHISPYRVYPGGLAVARAIGDIGLKEYKVYSAEPEVTVTMLTPQDEFLVLACDGVWDVLSSELVIDVAKSYLRRGHEPDQVCRRITRLASQHGSTDNISVCIVQFTPPQ
jgi:serine/threonine protein phosphatase PrpC